MAAPKKRRAPVMGLDVPFPTPKANARLQAWVLDVDGDAQEVIASVRQLMSTWVGSTFEVMGLTGTQAATVKTKRCVDASFEPARWPSVWAGVGVDILTPHSGAAYDWMKQAVKAARTHLRRRHPTATVLFLVCYYRPGPTANSILATVGVSLPKHNGRFGYESTALKGQDLWARGVLYAKWYEQWCTARVMGLMLEEVLERSDLKGGLETTLAQARSRQMEQVLSVPPLQDACPVSTGPRL